MTFAHPDWLWLLLIVPILLAGKLWADSRAAKAVDSLAARRLQDALVIGKSARGAWLVFLLQLAALACFIITLCRPQWGEEKRELRETGRNILIAIDTSRSMLANDVTPDRLTRAKLAAQDLLAALPQDRVGLIAFAGQAYLQAPLTTDHDAVIESIQALDHTSVPRGGSDITKAVRLAIETVEKSPARSHGLVIFSDGGEPVPGIPYYAKQAADKRILVVSIGVGSETGSLIPDPEASRSGDFVRDNEGNVVQSKLDGAILQEIASATNGRYLKLGSAPVAQAVVNDALASLDRQQDAAREERKPIERFRWPLSVGMMCLMIAWLIRPSARRPRLVAGAAAVALFGMAPPQASAADDGRRDSLLGLLLSNQVSEASDARDAYSHGEFGKARDVYARLLAGKGGRDDKASLSYGLGASTHQLKDYDRAASAFSDALESSSTALQNQAHQGLAHTLYDQGDRSLAKQPQFTVKAWTDSLRHFDAALALNDNTNVRENREFVQKRLDELKQQIEQQKQQQKKEGDKGDSKSDGKGKKGDKSDKAGQKGGKGEQGRDADQDQQDQAGDKKGDEKKDGKGEEEEQGKQGKGKPIPEGQIQAGQGGEKPEEEAGQQELAESERDETTGFSRNEARAFLRTYADDQKAVQYRQQRREAPNGRDW